MAATVADVAFGVTMKRETAPASGTFSDIALELTSVTPPGFTRDQLDATHHQSPEGWSESILSAIKKQKPIAIEFNWLPGDTTTIMTWLVGDMVNYQIGFPDDSTVTVKAGVSDFSPGAMTPDGKMSASAEFTPSGKPVWASA